MRPIGKAAVKQWSIQHPFPVLVRHFFQRLFQNDFVAFEDQMKEKTISLLAIIAILSAHVANSVLMKYMLNADLGTSWMEKCFFASFIMLLLGFITVFEWDVLFPDSRDFSNLLVLPLKLKTIFTAKFASLCGFVGLFALGANIFSFLPFWFNLPKWQAENDFLFFTYFILVHLICMLAACFFVFFFAVFLIGVLMLILPMKIFQSLSLFIRTVFMISFMFMMIFVVISSVGVSQPFHFLSELKANHSPLFYALPPAWFTGLYETLLGNIDPQFQTCALLALLSLVFVIAGFFTTSALGYRKYCRKAEVKKKTNQRFLRFKHSSIRIFNAVFLPNPIQRGIFYFFGKTLRQSMIHKMRLATFAAAGFALGLILLVFLVREPVVFTELNKTILSIPLIWTFFLMAGVRSIVNIPSRLEANWIFRLTEDRSLKHYAAGLRKGIVFFLLLPLAFLVSVFSAFMWGWAPGFLHGIFGFVMSALLMEIVFLKWNKIPFSCAYLPGQARAHILWPAYIVFFLAYVSLSGTLEWFLLKNPFFFIYFLAAAVSIILILKIVLNRRLQRLKRLVYTEEPEPALVTLLTYSHK